MEIVVIPNFFNVGSFIKQELGNISNLLIPLEGKPVIEYIYDRLKKQVNAFVVVVDSNQYDALQDYIIRKNYFPEINVICINDSKSLVESIVYGIDFARNKYGDIDHLIVNYGDTLVDEEIDMSGNKIVYALSNDVEKWDAYTLSKTGKLNTIKYKENNYFQEKSKIFVGLFGFSNVEMMHKMLKYESLKNNPILYNVIKKYSEKHPFKEFYSQNWSDVGHASEYQEAKKMVKARYFNTIQLDNKRGMLLKKSENKDKFFGEINWYLKLPLEVQYLVPRIYDFSLDYENMYINMEYYGYSTLHELFLWGDLSFATWEMIMQKILFVFEELKSQEKVIAAQEFRLVTKKMYYIKTIDRLKLLQKDPQFESFFSNNIFINGKEYYSINTYVSKLDELLDMSGIYDGTKLQIVHGDYCASNILIDVPSSIIRLIDPRGDFGGYDIYGDGLYDFAKLMHSFDGLYDFIIADQFYVGNKHNHIEFDVFIQDKHREISSFVMDKLKAYDETGFYQSQLIEAILFLSMIPLHNDFPKRQMAMLSTGIPLIHQAYEYYMGEFK